MRLLQSLAAGFAGSIALTITHQVLHRLLEDAPRMDLMGAEALKDLADKAGKRIPPDKLYNITLAGDILSNGFYYSLAGIGDPKHATLRGTLIGLAAGVGGVYLPKHLGLNEDYSNRTTTTRLLTIGIYTLGGFIAGKIICAQAKKRLKASRVTDVQTRLDAY